MASANQYDRQNDAELGSGIYDTTKAPKSPAKQIKNVCYCNYRSLGIPCLLHDKELEEEVAESLRERADELEDEHPGQADVARGAAERLVCVDESDLGESPTETRSNIDF